MNAIGTSSVGDLSVSQSVLSPLDSFSFMSPVLMPPQLEAPAVARLISSLTTYVLVVGGWIICKLSRKIIRIIEASPWTVALHASMKS